MGEAPDVGQGGAEVEAAGHEVSTHAGAFGATQVIMKTRPNLVLLDLNMPGLP